MNRQFKTEKGTELPVLNLRGKEYLEVKYRLVWFREEHPDWSIETELVSVTDKSACAKATIKDSEGRLIATSHKFENERGFPDFIEKAETGAIGRALALIGFGTQFCADDFSEGERIVDSPVDARPGLTTEYSSTEEASSSTDPGDFLISFGKKFKGKKLKDVSRQEIESYLAWMETEAHKQKKPLSQQASLLKKAIELYYDAPERETVSEAS